VYSLFSVTPLVDLSLQKPSQSQESYQSQDFLDQWLTLLSSLSAQMVARTKSAVRTKRSIAIVVIPSSLLKEQGRYPTIKGNGYGIGVTGRRMEKERNLVCRRVRGRD